MTEQASLDTKYKELFQQLSVKLGNTEISVMNEALFIRAAQHIEQDAYNRGINDGIDKLSTAIEDGLKAVGI